MDRKFIFNWIRASVYAQQRRNDLATVWPAIRREAPNVDAARVRFTVHAVNSAAWRYIGMQAVNEVIDRLA